MGSLRGKTLFITGASRGVGRAIALRAARDGANIVIAAKTQDPHPKLPGTIHDAAMEIQEVGGKALPCPTDIRFEDQVQSAVESALKTFGGIDILINNASVLNPTGTLETDMKRFDLMMGVNLRGAFLCSKLCLPHLKKASNPHVLNIAPPPSLDPKWFAPHVGYTIAKFGMSLLVLGMAEEFRDEGIAFNGLWPKTMIATAAVINLLGGEESAKRSRKPEIMADAAHDIMIRDSRSCTGNFFVDEEVLKEEGVVDFRAYQVDPSLKEGDLFPDFFL